MPDSEQVVYTEKYISNDGEVYGANFLKDGSERLDEKIARYTSEGSGWIIDKILSISFIITL